MLVVHPIRLQLQQVNALDANIVARAGPSIAQDVGSQDVVATLAVVVVTIDVLDDVVAVFVVAVVDAYVHF